MEPQLLRHQSDIAALCRAFGVVRLEVFGSASNGGFNPVSSDYDFIVHFAARPGTSTAKRFLGLSDALERLLERKVDLMTDRPIANPYLRAAVETSRKTVYAEPAAQAPV